MDSRALGSHSRLYRESGAKHTRIVSRRHRTDKTHLGLQPEPSREEQSVWGLERRVGGREGCKWQQDILSHGHRRTLEGLISGGDHKSALLEKPLFLLRADWEIIGTGEQEEAAAGFKRCKETGGLLFATLLS